MDSDKPTGLAAALAKELEAANAALNASTGACLVTNPGSPRPYCVKVTPEQCSKLGGSYVGGDCP
jgi:hypothetical protein